MALINRLIAEARQGVSVIWINASNVNSLAEHARMIGAEGLPRNATLDQVSDYIYAGRFRLLGVPVRVRGNPPRERIGV
jgi:hypothetical protein